MSEQYRCKTCGYTFDMKDMMCSECGEGYFEQLRWTKGGDGSHWDGCEDVHWDCKIAQLEAEIARLTAELSTSVEIIHKLKEDASRLADCVENSRETPNSMCLVQHRALMKKLEEK